MLNDFAYNSIIEDEFDITYINPYVEDLLDDLLNYNDQTIEEKQKDNKVNLILQGIIK
mgnify:CR=1 FL=1